MRSPKAVNKQACSKAVPSGPESFTHSPCPKVVAVAVVVVAVVVVVVVVVAAVAVAVVVVVIIIVVVVGAAAAAGGGVVVVVERADPEEASCRQNTDQRLLQKLYLKLTCSVN